MKCFHLAIDGPVAAGKSTVAKGVARKLGFVYIDTGAMYRAVALAAKQQGINWEDPKALATLAKECKLRLARPIGDKNDGRIVSVYLDNEDVSWEIRKPSIAEGASVISQFAPVRKVLVHLQQEMSEDEDVVMEGRDIGTKVLPKAQLKIYMSASLESRVKRKREQMLAMGKKQTYKEVEDGIVTRDTREMNRKASPLKPAAGAWKLDTTDLAIDQVIDMIFNRVVQMRSA